MRRDNRRRLELNCVEPEISRDFQADLDGHDG
jgi:hypothetical protein